MPREFSKLIGRYGERYSTATIYVVFVAISLVAAGVLFGLMRSSGVMQLAFAGSAQTAEFGGAFAGFLATLIVLLRAYSRAPATSALALTGNVLTADGRPVTGADVFVEGVDRRKSTDATGWFRIDVEDRKSWVVRVTCADGTAEATVRREDAADPVRLVPKRTGPEPVAPPREPVWRELQHEFTESFDVFDDSPAAAQSVLAGTLILGTEREWNGILADGAYLLSNATQRDGVQYFHLGLTGGDDLGDRLVATDVRVSAQAESSAGGGLLYRFDGDGPHYYAFTLHNDGSVALRRRDDAGFRTLYSGRPASL